jgi:hypothetical protein
MKNPIIEAKIEIIEWVKNLDELETIQELLDLKNKIESIPLVSEPQAEYALKDDFDERFAKAIPHEEMRRRTIAHIRSMPWKQ